MSPRKEKMSRKQQKAMFAQLNQGYKKKGRKRRNIVKRKNRKKLKKQISDNRIILQNKLHNLLKENDNLVYRAQKNIPLKDYIGYSGHPVDESNIEEEILMKYDVGVPIDECSNPDDHEHGEEYCIDESIQQLLTEGILKKEDEKHGFGSFEYVFLGLGENGVCVDNSPHEVINNYARGVDGVVIFTPKKYISDDDFKIDDGYYVVPDFSKPVVFVKNKDLDILAKEWNKHNPDYYPLKIQQPVI